MQETSDSAGKDAGKGMDNDLMICDLCGLPKAPAELFWTEDWDIFCCAECMSEDDNCGCSD